MDGKKSGQKGRQALLNLAIDLQATHQDSSTKYTMKQHTPPRGIKDAAKDERRDTRDSIPFPPLHGSQKIIGRDEIRGGSFSSQPVCRSTPLQGADRHPGEARPRHGKLDYVHRP